MFLLIVSVLIVSLIYLNVIKPIFYWRKSGIFHVPLWKEVSQTLFSNKSFFETTTDEYKQFPDRRLLLRIKLENLVIKSAAHFVDFFFVNDDEVIELEMKNVFSRYTNDVIANCAFGIKCDSLKEKTNQFYTMGEALTVPKGTNALRGLVAAFFPSLFE
ncbi:hypothetical protein NQ315_004459, partial [Exocentrus adspersus]